ncbi:hypothetical protein BOTBODRAFT_179724 [Botryobasidium botryosum FD-172 SS1]|uniref:Uncharacterized protein n=1 Tax=Botryobasidium botryosum (strain FD-172 SS1) TaxID=930990 RepID=A0A067MAM1_BOTB1|nr:hypothetical protein BOTBODRAFT_179724 [Botryobasidium botryosum FD-172 SS1]
MGLFHHSHDHEKKHAEKNEEAHAHDGHHKHAQGPDLTFIESTPTGPDLMFTGVGIPASTTEPDALTGHPAAHEAHAYHDVTYSGAGVPTGTADPPMFHDAGHPHPERVSTPQRPHKDVTDTDPAEATGARHESRDITDI